jgi:hypothetical protein
MQQAKSRCRPYCFSAALKMIQYFRNGNLIPLLPSGSRTAGETKRMNAGNWAQSPLGNLFSLSRHAAQNRL